MIPTDIVDRECHRPFDFATESAEVSAQAEPVPTGLGACAASLQEPGEWEITSEVRAQLAIECSELLDAAEAALRELEA